jgi:hypothetical protein
MASLILVGLMTVCRKVASMVYMLGNMTGSRMVSMLVPRLVQM